MRGDDGGGTVAAGDRQPHPSVVRPNDPHAQPPLLAPPRRNRRRPTARTCTAPPLKSTHVKIPDLTPPAATNSTRPPTNPGLQRDPNGISAAAYHGSAACRRDRHRT